MRPWRRRVCGRGLPLVALLLSKGGGHAAARCGRLKEAEVHAAAGVDLHKIRCALSKVLTWNLQAGHLRNDVNVKYIAC